MNKKQATYLSITLILIISFVIFIGVKKDQATPKTDEQGRTLIGIDDPNYDPKKDPNNPYNDDNQDKEGNYFYENKDLGFNITLPPEFIYFQTQRWDNTDFTDLEILIPTNDPEYTLATPPSYAKPIIVRIFKNKEFWGEEDPNEYVIFGEKKEKTYTLKFWNNPTKDWAEKWTNEMKVKIGQNVNMIK